MRRSLLVVFFAWFSGFTLTAQSSVKLEPIFPQEIPGFIFLEAEDAFSTNFSKEPILDYSSSGLRLLQLNKAPGAPGAPFFADYTFYVEEPGDYELWLGGTPPGPKDELTPSYSSPLRVTFDGKTTSQIYRESVTVVDSYSLTNFWSQVKNRFNLTKGIHTIRVEVTEKRRFDSRYYFYLDCLFLLKPSASEIPTDLLPAIFPKDRNNRNFDRPYLTISQYEGFIQNNPRELSGYLELAKVYSILGDYNNSLKVLNRARLIAPEDPQITLLQAKNRIWSGDSEEGLKLYREYLKKNTGDIGLLAEAAKVFAWLGQYSSSLEIYQEAQKAFPEDINLKVNYGLTHLWANRVNEGNQLLDGIWNLVKNDEKKIKTLAEIYQVNGYPEKTLETYLKAVKAFPGSLEFLLLLQETYLKRNDLQAAQNTKKTILDLFETSDRLISYLEIFELKESLRQKALDGFKERLAQSPDDLKLREEMVQAYFWNGRRDEAIDETQNILVNKLFRQIQVMDKDSVKLFNTLDQYYSLNFFLLRAKSLTEEKINLLKRLTSEPTTPPEALDEAATASARLIEVLNAAVNLSASLTQEIEGLEKDYLGEKKILETRLPWTWDKENLYQDLRAASRRSVPLADYLLARLNLFEKSPGKAEPWLSRIWAQDSLVFMSLKNQSTLWSQGNLDPDTLKKETYFSYYPALAETLKTLNEKTPPRKAVDKPETLLNGLSEALPRIQSQMESSEKNLLKLHDFLMTKTALNIYQFDLDTTDVRYQLGDYYLSRGRNFEARRQLEKFMVLNPGNISGKFSLGRARQLSGDWAGAMALYKSVYQTDPKFENAASLHNQLAKQHPDRFFAGLKSFVDDARTTTQGRLEFQASGSSVLSLSGAYTLDMLRVFKDTVDENPATISLHSIELTLPLTLNDYGITLSGSLGGTLRNDLLENYIPIGGTFSPRDLGTQGAVSPILGAGAKYKIGNFYSSLDYRFSQIQDTFLPGRIYHFAHNGELNASYQFDLGASSAFRSINTRVYGKFAEVFNYENTTPNELFTAVTETVFGFHVADAPWTNLSLIGTGSWEDSARPSEKNYYSPEQVANLKASVLGNTWIGLGSDWVLGIALRGTIGFYQSKSLSTVPEPYLLTEGEGRLELSKGDLTMFLDIAGSQAQGDGRLGYWSLQAHLGVSVAVPDYLIP